MPHRFRLREETNLTIFRAWVLSQQVPLGGDNGQIWTRRRQIGEERDAPQEKRKFTVRKRRQRRKGEEPKAGHRHRSFGSSKEGRQGSAKEIKLTTTADRAQAKCTGNDGVRGVRPEALKRAACLQGPLCDWSKPSGTNKHSVLRNLISYRGRINSDQGLNRCGRFNPQGFSQEGRSADSAIHLEQCTAVTNKHWRIRPRTNTQYVERRVSRLLP